MSEVVGTDLISLLSFLLPGFVAAWVFYGLTSHSKPSQFERIVQALILTFIVQALIAPMRWAFFLVGEIFTIGTFDKYAEKFTLLILALIVGGLLALFTNNDGLHRALRKFGFTSRTSHPSEWYYVLSEKVTFVILQLTDGRRLYGWPKEWPIEPDKGQFYIMLPSWIDDEGKPIDLPELDGVLIDVKDVKWLEFLDSEGDKT